MSYSPFGQTLPAIPVGGDAGAGAGILSAPTVEKGNPISDALRGAIPGSSALGDALPKLWEDFKGFFSKWSLNAVFVLVLLVLLFAMLNYNPVPGAGVVS